MHDAVDAFSFWLFVCLDRILALALSALWDFKIVILLLVLAGRLMK